MNDQPRKVKVRNTWTAEHDAVVQQIAAAAQRVKESDTPGARAELFEAVEAARVASIGWTKIGDTLGIASGNAYKRYRKHPDSSGGGQPRAIRHDGSKRCGAGESNC